MQAGGLKTSNAHTSTVNYPEKRIYFSTENLDTPQNG